MKIMNSSMNKVTYKWQIQDSNLLKNEPQHLHMKSKVQTLKIEMGCIIVALQRNQCFMNCVG